MTTNIISFPGLNLGPFSINPTAFTLFGREIRWYGIIICVGIILGFIYSVYRAKHENISFDDMLDYAIFMIPAAIIGARAYYVLTTLGEYNSFYEVIAIWNGGIAIYGAIIGGLIAVFVVSKFKKIKTAKVLDAIAPGVLIGQIIGRYGNFTNAEAYGVLDGIDFLGKSVKTPSLTESFPLRMTIAKSLSSAMPKVVHPTFLYESVWNIIGFIIISALYKKKKFDGQIVLMYVAWYGFGRFFIEGLREDSLWLGSFRISQLLALLSFIICVVLLILLSIKKRNSVEEEEGSYEKVFAAKGVTAMPSESEKTAEPAEESEPSEEEEVKNSEQPPENTEKTDGASETPEDKKSEENTNE